MYCTLSENQLKAGFLCQTAKVYCTLAENQFNAGFLCQTAARCTVQCTLSENQFKEIRGEQRKWHEETLSFFLLLFTKKSFTQKGGSIVSNSAQWGWWDDQMRRLLISTRAAPGIFYQKNRGDLGIRTLKRQCHNHNLVIFFLIFQSLLAKKNTAPNIFILLRGPS